MPINAHGQQVGDPVPGWTAAPRPVPVVLTGRHVRLVPLSQDHVDGLLATICGPDDDASWTYRGTDRPGTATELAALVETDLADPGSLTFAVVPTATGVPSGLSSYLRIDATNGCLEIGAILFARSLRRTAATTESTHLLLRHAFDDLGYRRVEWKCDRRNEPSRRAARRLGFVHEGTFRHHLVVKGRNRDTDWFALTDEDWPAVRAAHEQWLAGVGPDGRERKPLSGLTARLLT